MSAGDTVMEPVLDQFLAARRDPSVPSDLARRIVVSTAHLRQVEPDDGADQVHARPAPVLSLVRRRRWAGISAGAAMAASLALAVLTQMPASQPGGDPSPLHADASSGSASIALAEAPVVAAPAALPAAAIDPSVVPTATASLAMADSNPAAPAPAPAAEPAAKPAAEAAPVQLAQNWHGGDLEEFALAKNSTPAEQVYGPVLDQDRYGVAYGPSASSSPTVSLGINGGAGMAPAGGAPAGGGPGGGGGGGRR